MRRLDAGEMARSARVCSSGCVNATVVIQSGSRVDGLERFDLIASGCLQIKYRQLIHRRPPGEVNTRLNLSARPADETTGFVRSWKGRK
jgi:hypothetical protein